MVSSQLQSLLEQVVAHYQAMADLMQQLDGALYLEDPELLAELQEELTRVQEQARATDALIAPLLPEAPVAGLAALISERKALLEGLQEQNRLISAKIRGILPVIAEELGQLRTGQTALSAYAGGPQARGESIRGSY